MCLIYCVCVSRYIVKKIIIYHSIFINKNGEIVRAYSFNHSFSFLPLQKSTVKLTLMEMAAMCTGVGMMAIIALLE